MPKTRRNKGRAGKVKNFKQKQQHKAFFIFDKLGREIREGRTKAELEEMNKIIRESAERIDNVNAVQKIFNRITNK